MFEVEGVDYSPEGIEAVRQELIELRNNALMGDNFEWATLLSHAIAHAAHHKEMVETLGKKGDHVYEPNAAEPGRRSS